MIQYDDSVEPIPGVVAVAEDNASSIARKCLETFMDSNINGENYREIGRWVKFEELLNGLSEAEKREVYAAILKKAADVKEKKPSKYPDYYLAVEYFKIWYFGDIVIKGGNEARLPLTDSAIKKARAERNFHIVGKRKY